jgi:hypothetical protein
LSLDQPKKCYASIRITLVAFRIKVFNLGTFLYSSKYWTPQG